MKTRETVVLCDIDGVIKACGDGPYVNIDTIDIRLINLEGQRLPFFTFSPAIISKLNEVIATGKFAFLTSWNHETTLLSQIGLSDAGFLLVDTFDEGTEKSSKIFYVEELAKTYDVIWIDDFADEWFDAIAPELRDHVTAIQPDYNQGLTMEDFWFMDKLVG